MMTKVLQIASEEMTACNFRGARPVWVSDTSASIEVYRTHLLCGSVTVSFDLDVSTPGSAKWVPVVRVNMPAINANAMVATAYLAMLQELTMFAASLQVQLNQYDIPAKV